jgi:hypothetical protein
MPWTTRNAISEPMFQAAPAATDAARKTLRACGRTGKCYLEYEIAFEV